MFAVIGRDIVWLTVPTDRRMPTSVHAANDDATAPVPDMQASAAGDGDADLIQEASDKSLAIFSSKRKLLLDLGKDSFYYFCFCKNN
jgi:hypothetical protein